MARETHNVGGNKAELRQWLDTRRKSLESSRLPFESLWRELRSNFEPYLGRALDPNNPDDRLASREDDKIYNTEPRILLHRMAAGLQSGITSQAQQWFRLRCRDTRLSEASTVRRWLDKSTEAVNALFARSNVYPALDQIYLHLGCFGNSAALALPDDEFGMHMHVIDEGAYWIAENRRGRIDTLLRRMEMTLSVAAAEFGVQLLPESEQERIKNGRHEDRLTVWHLIAPNDGKRFKGIPADSRPFVSVYWLEGKHNNDAEAGIVAIRSFGYNPIIAPRWFVFGSAYGIGCGQIGLSDAKQLQALEFDKLKLIEQEVDPSLIAPDSMKDEPIFSGPGGVTYYPEQGQRGSPAIGRLFDSRTQIDAILLAIQATEGRLARTFYSDLFAMLINLNMRPKQMTAREVQELASEKVALLGPILTRLNTDMLDPLVDAGFAIAAAQGLLPQAPDIIQGQDLRVEYVSSLHMEQQSATRLGGLIRLAEFTGAIAGFIPTVVDKLDGDQTIDIAAQVLVEHGVVRDDKAVAALREERARQQAAQEQQAAMAQQAKAVKDLSQSPVGQEGQTALDVAIQQPGV
jgi:hypothetical protein